MRFTAVLSCLVISLAAASTAQSQSETASLKKKITKMIVNTHSRQYMVGVRLTPTRYLYKSRRKLAVIRRDYRWWGMKAKQSWVQFVNPPHRRDWLCIHRFEGSWQDANDPYWGGLQMDRGFMRSYAPLKLLHKGWANVWSPLEQMWVAERAHRSGRGFGPWPNTARSCGLL